MIAKLLAELFGPTLYRMRRLPLPPAQQVRHNRNGSPSPTSAMPGKELIRQAVSLSFPLHLLPDQSDVCTEYATWAIQQPIHTSLVIVLAKPVGWSNWLEEAEVVLICVLNQAAEAAYSEQAFDWSGSGCRGKEGPNT